MKSYQIRYENTDNLVKKLREIKGECEKLTGSSVTFYLTWTESTRDSLKEITEKIQQHFPDAPYYGNEASGNILNGELAYGTTITCYVFEEESTKTKLLWVEKGTELGSLQGLWNYCKKEEGLKAVELIPSISYLEALKMDNSIADISEDILLFGGASVNYDNPTFVADIIAKGHELTREGMAVMLYYGENFNASAAYVLGWKGLGRNMTVTKSHDDIIEEIDGVPAYSIYEKYLNLQYGDNDNLVFPLIIEDEGVEYIRTPQAFLPDKSMRMFANIDEGLQARISYGDKNTILSSLYEKASEIVKYNPQAIKAYSCAARRLFWGDDDVHRETMPLQGIAQTCGFYTGGEILRFGNKLRVLNSTLVIISFREGEADEPKNADAFKQSETDTSLISRLTYFAEKTVEEEQAQRLLVEGMESAFASRYQVLYYIDLKEGKATLIHGDEDAKKFMPIFNTNSMETMFDNFNKMYVEAAIAEEDRERVRTIMNVENVLRELKKEQSISVNFKVRRNLQDPVYMEMSFIKAGEEDGKLTAAMLTFKLSTEELRTALELNAKLQNDLLNEMLGDDGVFLIDCKNDRRKTVHDNLHGSDNYNDEDRYTELIARYIDTFVPEIDREMMREVTSPEYMLNRLESEKEYTVAYRDITTGVQRFYEMRVARFSENEVLQSFAEKDKEIIDRMLLEKMEDAYFALLGVDLESGLVQALRKAPWYPMGEVGEVAPYKVVMQAFAEANEGKTRKLFENISDVEYLKDIFAEEDRLSYTYKSSLMDDEKYIIVTGFAIERKEDGTPSILAIGFSFTDSMETEKLKLQEQLQVALHNAEIANQAKTNFLFNMSHDIRTPMNAIKGFTTMAKKYSNDTNKVMDYLNKIDISGQQLLSLVNQVLEMARIESGKIELDEKTVHVGERFEALVTVLSAQAKANGLTLHYAMEDITHFHVIADDTRMGQITLNIVGNALKYTPEGGKIDYILREIPCERKGYARMIFTVADTGIGMSKEYLDNIFEPFSRESTTTVSKIQGAGLGMTIVKNLVDLLGGTIEVQSEPGKGTRFDITLDFKIDEKSETAIPVSTEAISDVSFVGRRVLLVEDNEMNREIAKDLLEENGFIVEEADDGDVAVEMVKKTIIRNEAAYYDFVLMDIQMPRMNGYEATRAIRAIPQVENVHLPIIAMTANAFEEDRINALEAGMDEHLAKPVDMRLLLETLARFL